MSPERPLLDEEMLDIIENLTGKAMYLQHGDYHFLSLRNLSLTKDSLHTTSIVFLIANKRFWKIKGKGTAELCRLGSVQEFLQQIKSLRLSLRSIFGKFSDQVDDLEDELLEGASTRYFHSTWFSLKKEISVIERTITRNVLALDDFLMDYQLPKGELRHMHSILAYFNSDLRSCQGDLQKLDSANQYVAALKSEKLNKNMYLLALVSGVFLPLNLIVGFFGMNTENLFFSGHPSGTWYVVIILAAVFAFLITGLPILYFLDQLILKRLIGRNDIYRKIQGKIGSFMIDSNNGSSK